MASVETGLDQSAYLGQLGHFSLVTQVTGSNYRNQIIQLIFLKMATVDSERLSTNPALPDCPYAGAYRL